MAKLKATDIDKEFAKNFFDTIDTTETRIEDSGDILDIIVEYRNFVLNKALRKDENRNWRSYEPIKGLNMMPGITLVYGPPDTLKTYIGINVANWFADNTDLDVCYIDAENKLWNADTKAFRDKIYMVPGRSDTHNLVRKLVSENSFQVLIIDTIVALSRYEDFLRNVIKYIDVHGVYILLLNQTVNYKYGEESAGKDVIQELAYQKHRLLEVEHTDKNYYVSTDTGLYFGFSGTNRSYSLPHSIYYKCLKNGEIQEREGILYYKDIGYSSKDAVLLAITTEYKNKI
jgi:hypothetical protein